MRLRRYLLAPLALALSGCGHLPVSTMWALRNFDASTADPASLRAAIRIPEGLEPRPGGVTLEVGWWRDGDEANKHDAKFVLQESTAETGSLAGERKPGTRIYAYRVNPADFTAIRAMQAEVLAEKKKAGAATHGVFGIGADACREADLASGPLYMTTFLKTGETTGFLTLLKDVDLRSLIPKDMSEDELLPPCGKFTTRVESARPNR